MQQNITHVQFSRSTAGLVLKLENRDFPYAAATRVGYRKRPRGNREQPHSDIRHYIPIQNRVLKTVVKSILLYLKPFSQKSPTKLFTGQPSILLTSQLELQKSKFRVTRNQRIDHDPCS